MKIHLANMSLYMIITCRKFSVIGPHCNLLTNIVLKNTYANGHGPTSKINVLA
jgi:hypothetical protein